MINVIRFTATYCMPCKALAPEFTKFEKEFPDVNFLTVDVEQDPKFTELYAVRTVPTVIIKKDNDIVERLVGLQSRQKYVTAISSANEPK